MPRKFTKNPNPRDHLLAIQITEQLRQQLITSGLSPQLLVQRFRDWKLGHPDHSYFFARESLPAKGYYLCHAHMVPINTPHELTLWNLHWRLHRRRTSDRYVLYAQGGQAHGILLIAIINDPGAHDLWAASSKEKLAVFEHIAEQFCIFGQLPS